MSDRVFFGSAALLAICLIALALVWPQGQAARSPAPFGHAEIMPDRERVQRERQARAETPAPPAPADAPLVAETPR